MYFQYIIFSFSLLLWYFKISRRFIDTTTQLGGSIFITGFLIAQQQTNVFRYLGWCQYLTYLHCYSASKYKAIGLLSKIKSIVCCSTIEPKALGALTKIQSILFLLSDWIQSAWGHSPELNQLWCCSANQLHNFSWCQRF